jgi:YebC/PmpR family DNA-binding regulatory protein
MAGHSKWAGIKHKKAIVDARRGKVFTRIANMITVAAKEGGADPEMNFRLRLAMEKARSANMPQANVQRAIDRGTGKGGGAALEEITYEGFGPGGVAVLVRVLTDNRNRSAADVRSMFNKGGGKMAEMGSVGWMFEPRGIIRIGESDPERREELALAAIEAGADDVDTGDGVAVYTAPERLGAVQGVLREQGVTPQSELTLEPKETLAVDDPEQAKKVVKFLETLEDHDEVVEVVSNFDTALELEAIS